MKFIDRLTKRLKRYADKLEAEENKHPSFESFLNKTAATALAHSVADQRTILCPGVAVLIVKNRPKGLLPLLETANDPKEKDSDIAQVLGAVLKSNPEADLSPYEQTFEIKIIKVDLLSNPDQPPRAIDI